ncbi:MAG: sugar kinase [Leeuwenhoekiella sp.]|nr:MAG: sugar kinase [Leeuwenhoekiella sp.]
MTYERVIVVRDKTRLEQLIDRFNSKAQAEFYIDRSGGNFQQYVEEHEVFKRALNRLEGQLNACCKFKIIYRSFLSTFIFTETDLILVIGQDGLLANTAKYVDGQPIVGINPDVQRYDGVLVKHQVDTLEPRLKGWLSGKLNTEEVTMARATLSDGQTLLAFNDFYIGAASHVSSRYQISFAGKQENQSSSGVLVSTGAGSTGWLSSVFNMTRTISGKPVEQPQLNRRDNRLVFVVREPFRSKMSQISIGYGTITTSRELKITSQMPANGVIFSDGIESDFIAFNSGSTVTIGLADKKAILVV